MGKAMVEDTLSRVSITESVIARWNEVDKKAADALAFDGLDPRSSPDELVAVQADGSLLIFVDLPTGARISIVAAPHEWAWIGPSNH